MRRRNRESINSSRAEGATLVSASQPLEPWKLLARPLVDLLARLQLLFLIENTQFFPSRHFQFLVSFYSHLLPSNHFLYHRPNLPAQSISLALKPRRLNPIRPSPDRSTQKPAAIANSSSSRNFFSFSLSYTSNRLPRRVKS